MMQSDHASIKFIDNIEDNVVSGEWWFREETWSYKGEVDAYSVKEQFEPLPAVSYSHIKNALWNTQPNPINYDFNGVDKFFDLAKIMNLTPISKMQEMLHSDKVNLKFYGFDPRIVKAICDALIENTYVKELDLEGNLLSLDACFHLNELLRQNSTLVSLNLSGCKIKPNGIMLLNNSIIRSSVLRELNLSNCNIEDEGLYYLSNSVQENNSIIDLNLRNNNLTNACAEDMYKFLTYNSSIQKLNLSWNSLSSEKACEFIFAGLINNQCLKDIDLSWNSLGSKMFNKVIEHLCSFLLKNSKLEILRLNDNRFTENDAEKIGRALVKNKNLKKLYLGGNPINTNGALILIKNLVNTPDTGIEELELSHIWINKFKKPSSVNIEHNKIQKAADFKEVMKVHKKKFLASSLVIEILNTIPKSDPVISEKVKKRTVKFGKSKETKKKKKKSKNKSKHK